MDFPLLFGCARRLYHDLMASPKPIPRAPSTSGPVPAAYGMTVTKIAVAALLALGCGFFLWAHTEWFDDPQRVKAEITQWGIWAPVLYIALYAVGPSILLPGAVMTIAGGLAFGTLWGAIYAISGAFAGALIAFAAGRFLGRDFVQRITGERIRRVLGQVKRQGFRIIFYLRLFPVIPYNALNLIAGASPISFRDYFWATMLGLIPGTILFAFLGNELWHPGSPRFFLALFLILLCLGAGELYRRIGVQAE